MRTADELNIAGANLFLQGDLNAAKFYYLAALKVDPEFLPAMKNLAVIALQQNKLKVAVTLLRKILTKVSWDGDQWNNLGNALMRLERYDEAREALNKAAKFVPDNSGVWHNLALLEHRLDNWVEALNSLKMVESLGASSPQVTNDRAHMLLAQGDNLAVALETYEARWHTMVHLPPWDFHIPEWKGESLEGKRILVHGEQGFGDTIMCLRFLQDLIGLGATVTVAVPRDLISLVQFQDWTCVTACDITMEGVEIDFDYHSPMYGMMRWLGVERNNIDSRPYLETPVRKFFVPGAFNVGICWASGIRGNEMDWRRRVTSLEDWLPLAEVLGVCLWSLQKGPEVEEIESLGAEPLIEISPLGSWLDTAALISQLDLVITVDTAVAHLAGALGKPVWMLTQFQHCWRWWNINEGSGRPWYRSMTIIPQKSPGDWKEQLEQCFSNLRALNRETPMCQAAE